MTCNNNYDYKCDDCVDAWQLSREYGCNESPNPVTDLNAEVEVGDCVEANHSGERFWIKVTDVCTCYIIGIVVSDLYFLHPFSKGDSIRIELFQIYNVSKQCKNIF